MGRPTIRARGDDGGALNGSVKWAAAATMGAHACTLALILAYLRLGVYPIVGAGAVAQAASAATAALTLPGALHITGCRRLPGHLVAGTFGAPSGLGAMFLPTASAALLDTWDGVAPLATAAAMLSLAVMAERGAGSGGHARPVIEIALTLVMALLVMCPTCCLPFVMGT